MNRISERVNIAACLGLALLILLPIGRAKGANDNASKLLDLARKKFDSFFDPINEAEENLFQAVVSGETADCSDWLEKNNDPNMAKDWDQNTRVIRAKCLAWLCTDPEASALVTHKGIVVKGARIDGRLDLSFAKVPFQLAFLKSAVPEEMLLNNAEISSLVLDGTYTGPIQADGLKIEGDVLLRDGFKAEGEVRLVGATIGGNFACDSGQFINPSAEAISADQVWVGGDILLRDGFKAKGEVSLVGATIGGNLSCIKGLFVNPHGIALTVGGSNIKGSVFLSDGFQAKGEVNLLRATIDKFFVWRDVSYPENTELNLRSASIGILLDDRASWPHKLILDGLVYNEIDDIAPINVKERLNWLRLQPIFRPQPYEQLAEVLGKSGYDENAMTILIEKEKDRVLLTRLTWGQKFWYVLLGPMIDYGYRPLKTFNGIVVFVALGWFIFGIGYRVGLITPQNESAYVRRSVSPNDDGAEARELSDIYPRFNFLVYSVDAFVPLIDLHQVKYWLPNAKRGLKLLKIKGFSLHIGGLLRLYLWIHLTMGWVFTSVFIMGLTGFIRTKVS